MIKRIIFINNFPFSQRDFDRFGFALLKEAGFEVEMWDLSFVMCPQVSKTYASSDDFTYKDSKQFNKKDVFVKEVMKLEKSDFIIMMMTYTYDRLWLYRALGKSKAKYALFCANAVPLSEAVLGGQNKQGFLKSITSINFRKITHKILNKVPFSWLGLQFPKYILAGGQNSLSNLVFKSDKYQILWAHALDYDIFLKERHISDQSNNTAVFLDEYFPFHPDFIQLGLRPPVSAENYYTALNHFFSLVEKNLGLTVVVAAHPRSQYEKKRDYFQGRLCVRGQTAQLIKKSKLVLAHYGAGLSFANLFCKPVMFLTSDEFKNSPQSSFIEMAAQLFGKETITFDIEENIDWSTQMQVNDRCYERYRNDYLKTVNSLDLPFWNIVCQQLKRDFN